MYQTPSQWAQGFSRWPSAPWNTSARTGKRQPMGRPWMPMKVAATNAAAKTSRRLPAAAATARASGRVAARPTAACSTSVGSAARLPRGAEHAVVAEPAQDGGAQVTGDVAPRVRVARPGVQAKGDVRGAQILYGDAVALAVGRRRQFVGDRQHRTAHRIDVARHRDNEVDGDHAPRGAHREVVHDLAGEGLVGDDDPAIVGRADERVREADLLDGAVDVVDADVVAEAHRLRERDHHAADEVGERRPRGDADDARDDGCGGEDGATEGLEEGELEQGHGDADDEDHRLDEAAYHHVTGAVGPARHSAQELGHGCVAAREEEVEHARRDDGDEDVDDGLEPRGLVERDGDQAHGCALLTACPRAKARAAAKTSVLG